MEKFCIFAADALSAPSMDMASTIKRSCSLGGKAITVIPNLLDLRLFSASLDRKVKTESKVITVLHVGRLDRVKGIEILIQAAPMLINQFPNVRFVLLGGGSDGYLEKLRQLLKSAGVKEDQFQFLGEVRQSKLFEWYQKADIAVVPTLNYESFSYTVAQAMAAGLPVIASRIGGIPETVGTDDVAILVEPGNEKQLAEALINLCKSAELRQAMGKAGLYRAQSYFSDGIVAKKTLVLYKSILSSGHN
jgi:1,4-alpha-glucan branching enzyme